MATLVAFHAHPDDEAISMGGTMAAAVDAGHRVVLVVATGGELGEVREGFLGPDEELGDVRRTETRAAADILGIHRVEFLGYRDSGMMGTPGNDEPQCFWQADVDEAARLVAAILREEAADVLTVYDDHGGYGHPDHIQVHRVGHRAAELADVPKVYEVTMNRDRMRAMMERAEAGGEDVGPEDRRERIEQIGTPDAGITTRIDVSDRIAQKRRAMRTHASQIDEDSWFLQMPEDAFLGAFGTEWFIQKKPPFAGDPVADRTASLF